MEVQLIHKKDIRKSPENNHELWISLWKQEDKYYWELEDIWKKKHHKSKPFEITEKNHLMINDFIAKYALPFLEESMTISVEFEKHLPKKDISQEEEITDIKKEGSLRNVEVLNKDGSTKEVKEVDNNYVLEDNEEYTTDEEYIKDQHKFLKIGIEKTADAIKIEQRLILKIDNYQDNAQNFWEMSPYFYDKTNSFWSWIAEEYKWEMVDDIFMMSKLDDCLGFCGQTITAGIKRNYIEALKRIGRKHKPKPAPKKWIQFKDKAISLESGKVYDVTYHYFFTNPIPHEIGKSEDTPVIDKLIKEWVKEDYVQTAYEVIAYCCYSDYPIHLILCLVGCGRNGKSKFQGLINKFIGLDNICSTELDILLDSRFEAFKLFKKLVCSMGETNFNVLSKTSLLKKLTGQDLIGFEYKHKKPFDDVNYAKIIISSNSLPPSTDTSEGFYRRWMILDFPNTFPEGHDILQTIPEIEYDNLALKVSKILPKLLKKGEFDKQGSIKERTEKYIMASNPLSFFINKHCLKRYDVFMRYSELYVAYCKYLKNNKRRNIGYKEFNDVLSSEGYEIVRTSKKIGDEFVSGRFIEGLSLVSVVSDMPVSTISSVYGEITEKPLITDITVTKETEQVYDTIHAKCTSCGSTPSHIFNKQGEPMCETCYKAKEANK